MIWDLLFSLSKLPSLILQLPAKMELGVKSWDEVIFTGGEQCSFAWNSVASMKDTCFVFIIPPTLIIYLTKKNDGRLYLKFVFKFYFFHKSGRQTGKVGKAGQGSIHRRRYVLVHPGVSLPGLWALVCMPACVVQPQGVNPELPMRPPHCGVLHYLYHRSGAEDGTSLNG